MSMSCNTCNQGCNSCNSCGCQKPILDIDVMPETVSILRFNINGLSSWFDYGNMIYQTQTDTYLAADVVKRVLNYTAERHTDSISAKELGSLLHLTDLGDVDGEDLTDGSMLVYHRDSNCAQGCDCATNSWVVWNGLDEVSSSILYPMGVDKDGFAKTLAQPTNTGQYYQMSWNASDGVSYTQPEKASSKSEITKDGKVYKLYLNPTTKEIVYLEEDA